MTVTCAAYHPSEEEAIRYWDQERVRGKSSTSVPSDFPERLSSPLVWTGAEVEKKQTDWKLELSNDDIAAIEWALKSFEAQYEELASISASTFELPAPLSQRLRQIAGRLYDGVGFQIVHGLDSSKYTARQNIIIYAGVSAHICPQRGQVDIEGREVISHIVNVDAIDKTAMPAPAFSNTALSFHTDNCEIMAFYYADTASKGGETLLASSWQTYNELAATRPEVLHTLAEPWILDSFKSYDRRPPRNVPMLERLDEDKVLLRFSRYPVTGWRRRRNPDLPEPTTAQLEAIDAVHFTAAKNAVQLPVVKGDMLFVNDMAVMHARRGFQEGSSNTKRHIYKMYLRDPEQGWPIPPSAEVDWMKMYGLDPMDTTKQKVWNVFYKPGLEDSGAGNG